MRMTIGKKLVGGFIFLALLVLLSGGIGYVVLGKVAKSADIVASDKAPVQYAVMKAIQAVERVEKLLERYVSRTTHLDELAGQISNGIDEYNMWISMIRLGTESAEFKKSPAGQRYKRAGLDIVIHQGSAESMKLVKKSLSQGQAFKKLVDDLIRVQNEYAGYAVMEGDEIYELGAYINLIQIRHIDWLRQLKDAVNIETTFDGVTDINKSEMGKWLKSYTVEDAELMGLFKKMAKQYGKLMALADKINSKAKYKEKIRLFNRGIGTASRIEGYFGKMHTRSAKIYEVLDSNKMNKLSDINASVAAINKCTQDLIARADKEMLMALESGDSVLKGGRTLLVIIILIAAVLAGLLGLFISRSITRNVQLLADATRKVAQGDLSEEVVVNSRDEIGDLSQDTNLMIKDLRKMIASMAGFSKSLTTASQGLAAMSDELENNSITMGETSDDAVSASQGVSTAMNTVAETAKESMTNVNSVASAIEEMTTTIAEISKSTTTAQDVTGNAVVTVDKTSQRMNELGKAASAINEVVEMIMGISSQTNLLALNATIEAARAGEAGKGFAVVAAEVKELARQTNEATGDISQRIMAIQESSQSSIGEMEVITGVINEINDIVTSIASAVEEQTATTQHISESVSSAATGIEEMTGSVNETAEVSRHVAESIGVVSQNSGRVKDSSAQSKKNSVELAALANELQSLVEQFKL